MYTRLPLKRRERREKESAGCYFQLSLFCVFLCVVCLYYYCAKRGIMSFCASSCVSSLACLFFLRTSVQKQKKEQKIGGRKKYTLKRQTTLEINFLKIRSNEQLIKNYHRHYSRSKSDMREVNVSDSEIRKLKIVYHLLECYIWSL